MTKLTITEVGGHAPIRVSMTKDQCRWLYTFAYGRPTWEEVKHFQAKLRYVLPDIPPKE